MAYGQNAPFGLKPVCSINGGSWTEKVNEYYIYTNPAGTVTYANAIYTGDPVIWSTSNGGTAANGLAGTIGVYNPNLTVATPVTFAGVGAAPILGVFMGCEYYSTVTATNNLIKSAYWPGGAQVVPGTPIKAYVIDDPNVIYDIQVSTSIAANNNAFVSTPYFPNTNVNGGAPFLQAGSFGSNFALSIGGGGNFGTVFDVAGNAIGYADNPANGSRLTGQSAFYLNVSTMNANNAAEADDYRKNTVTLPLRALGYTQNPNNIAQRNPVDPVAGPYNIGNTAFLNVRVTINNPVYAIGSAPTVYVA